MNRLEKYFSKRVIGNFATERIVIANFPSAVLFMGFDRSYTAHLHILRKDVKVKTPGAKTVTFDLAYGDKLSICIFETENPDDFTDATYDFFMSACVEQDLTLHDAEGFQVLLSKNIRSKRNGIGMVRTPRNPSTLYVEHIDYAEDEPTDIIQAIDMFIVGLSEQQVDISSSSSHRYNYKYRISSMADASIVNDFIKMFKQLDITPICDGIMIDRPNKKDPDLDMTDDYVVWDWLRIFLRVLDMNTFVTRNDCTLGVGRHMHYGVKHYTIHNKRPLYFYTENEDYDF